MNEKVNETRQCIYCKSEIDAHAIICLNCKKKQGKVKKCPFCKEKILAREKDVCPICGKNLKKLNIIVGVIVFVIIALFLAVGMQNMQTDDQIIMERMNVSIEQAEVIDEILKDVGVISVMEIARDEGLDDYYLNGGTDKGYRVAFNGTDTNNVKNTVIVNIDENGNVLVIKIPLGNVLYENGKAVDNIDNYR